jgi:hypothetical protein
MQQIFGAALDCDGGAEEPARPGAAGGPGKRDAPAARADDTDTVAETPAPVLRAKGLLSPKTDAGMTPAVIL